MTNCSFYWSFGIREELLDQFAILGAGQKHLIIQPQQIYRQAYATSKLSSGTAVVPVTSSVCSVKEPKGMKGLLASHICTEMSRKWEQLQKSIIKVYRINTL